MYEISQGWVSAFLWFHLIVAGILVVYWFAQLPSVETRPKRPGDDSPKPTEQEEAWPPWR